MEKDLLSMLMPEGLLDRFDVVNLEKGTDAKGMPYLKIHLDEKNILDKAYDGALYESKGFHQAKSIVDFPIRGRYVHLVLRRRRWRSKEDPTQLVSNDLSFLAEGTKMTRELAAFLKGTGGNP